MPSIGVMEVDFRHGRLDNLAVHQDLARRNEHLCLNTTSPVTPASPRHSASPGAEGAPCVLVELTIVVGAWASSAVTT